jgi:Transcriptional regulators
MTIFDTMKLKSASFTKTDQAIYDNFLRFPDIFARESISKITQTSGVSQAGLTRFAQKLGFKGYNELQYQAQIDIEGMQSETKKNSRADMYSQLLETTENSLSAKQMKSIAELIKKSNTVYLTGHSLSKIPADYLMALLSLCGIKSTSISTDKMWMLPYTYTSNDLLIDFSSRNPSLRHEIETIEQMPDRQPHTLLITTSPKHPLRKDFNDVVVLPTLPKSLGEEIVLGEQFSYMMFLDILIQYIIAAK